MGQIVGAAIVSHVPTLVLPEEYRRSINHGEDTTLFAGLHELRASRLDALDADTFVVMDSHWMSTVEHIVTSHDRREGKYTSEELPRGMRQVQYEMPGDRELAEAWARQADGRDDTWVSAIDDPYLPNQYPTINLLPFLQRDENWVSASICQTATPEDFLLNGSLLADAIASIDRRVVILASAGLSHRFWPLREFRDHQAADTKHVRTPEALEADQQVIDWLLAGQHDKAIDFAPEYRPFAPEGKFGAYLTMVGALGGADCTAKGVQFGMYESVAGTGQTHIWFDLDGGVDDTN